ncbi:MAG: rhomboid family intramembrane serine protease [Lachnospiraceae bacterium]|nr:rhomboid family intramembrane serine protease [Lachnospiraceae bacterium]
MKKKPKIILNAPIVISFVTISFFALLLSGVTNGVTNQLLFMTYHSSLKSPMTYLRFFTHVFGHADWEHFVGNMCYILLLGPMLEEKYRSDILAEVIIMTALVTGVINYILFPNVALCGASGVVFAFILMSSFTNFRAGEIPLTFILVAIFFMGKEIFQGMFIEDNISNMAHIVGGILGGILGYAVNKRSKARK